MCFMCNIMNCNTAIYLLCIFLRGTYRVSDKFEMIINRFYTLNKRTVNARKTNKKK